MEVIGDIENICKKLLNLGELMVSKQKDIKKKRITSKIQSLNTEGKDEEEINRFRKIEEKLLDESVKKIWIRITNTRLEIFFLEHILYRLDNDMRILTSGKKPNSMGFELDFSDFYIHSRILLDDLAKINSSCENILNGNNLDGSFNTQKKKYGTSNRDMDIEYKDYLINNTGWFNKCILPMRDKRYVHKNQLKSILGFTHWSSGGEFVVHYHGN